MLDRDLLGAAITRLRGDRSQRRIAGSVGISCGTWSNWESGQRWPRESQISKICTGLGCCEEDLRVAMWEIQAERLFANGSGAQPETLEARRRQHRPVLKVLREQFERMPEPVSKAVARLLVSVRETGQALNKIQADLEAVIVVLGQEGG